MPTPETKRHTDWLLEVFARAAGADKLPVTLAVGGMLVTGTIISEQEYMNALPMPEEMRKDVDRELLSGGDEPAGYVHLKGTRIVQGPGGMPITSSAGVYFRFRLSSVDGYTLSPIQVEVRRA